MLLTNTQLRYYDGNVLRLPAGKRTEYHAQVVAMVRAMAEPSHTERVERVLAALPPLAPADDPPFRRLHGDLWSGNLLWHQGRPALLDWE